jgi:tripartite-type tricarboxylate transporter receptor subunit TctC
MGAEPMPMSPDQFDKFVAEEIRSNAVLVKAAGVKGN